MSAPTLRFFGAPEAVLDGAAVPEVGQYRGFELLLLLALEPGTHDRGELASRLWPDRPVEAARRQLREGLFRLRRGLGDVLVADARSVRLDPARVTTDIGAFHAHLGAVRSHDHRRVETCPACLERLDAAVALYRGPLLAGFDGAGTFEDWLRLRRAQFVREVGEALTTLGEAAVLAADPARVSACALRQLELDPFDEPAHRRHLRALAERGQRAAALAWYDALAERMAREVGGEPDDLTEELYQRIRHNEPLDDAPAPAEAARRGGLPAPVGSFFGREEELETLLALLERPGCRLVTVLGPGGVGKSRIALEAAWRCEARFADGARWIELEPLDDAAQLVPALAAGCGVSLPPGGSDEAHLATALAGREILLVLDGMERLSRAALVLARLLRAAPRLRLLVSSRVALELREEHLLDLEGLAFDGVTSPAVRLWVARAQQVAPRFRLTEEVTAPILTICREVQGVPLALELSAAAARRHSPLEIADRIHHDLDALASTFHDTPPHHRSLRAVFDRSWGLLSPRRRNLLARLSVFEGGFSAEAAREVTGAPPGELEALATRSLLRRSAERWSMHLLVQRFARERLEGEDLAGDGEATGEWTGSWSEPAEPQPGTARAARAAHAWWFAGWLKERAEALSAQSDPALVGTIAVEWENLRAAWRSGVEHLDVPLLDTLLGPLNLAVRALGWFTRGAALFAELGVRVGDPTDARVRHLGARAAAFEGLYVSLTGRADDAVRVLERGVALARGAEDPVQEARSLRLLGSIRRNLGDLPGGLRDLEDSLRRFEAGGGEADLADTRYRLATACYEAGELDRAIHLFTEAERGFLTLGMAPRAAQVLAERGLARVLGGDHTGVAELQRAWRRQRDGGFVEIVDTLCCLTQVSVEMERWRDGLRRAKVFLERARPMGFAPGICIGLYWSVLCASRLGQLEEARRALAELCALALQCRSERSAAEALGAHAWLCADEGALDTARATASALPALSPEASRYNQRLLARIGDPPPRTVDLWDELGRVAVIRR